MAVLFEAYNILVDEREFNYSKRQESNRKGIERFFSVLQSWFDIMRRENRLWKMEDIVRVGDNCVLIHNIIVLMVGISDEEDEGAGILTEMYEEEEGDKDYGGPATESVGEKNEKGIEREAFQLLQEEIMSKEFLMPIQSVFKDLQRDLIESLSP